MQVLSVPNVAVRRLGTRNCGSFFFNHRIPIRRLANPAPAVIRVQRHCGFSARSAMPSCFFSQEPGGGRRVSHGTVSLKHMAEPGKPIATGCRTSIDRHRTQNKEGYLTHMFRKKRSTTTKRNSLGFICPSGPVLSSVDLTPFLSDNNSENPSRSDSWHSSSSNSDRDDSGTGRTRLTRRVIRRR